MDKQKWYIVAGSIGVIIFLFISYQLTERPKTQVNTSNAQLQKLNTGDHTTWSKDNKILLIEYSDLQCPACKVYHEYLSELAKDENITSRITFVYRHFPLDGVHEHARVAAHAAEAAGKQNAFFEMQNLLFTKQTEWVKSPKPQKIFTGYAKSLKLDVAQFEKDMASTDTAQRVQNDLTEGMSLQVDSTPTFFLNGVKLSNPQTVDEFTSLLTAQLKK